jgi:hypothetical protein
VTASENGAMPSQVTRAVGVGVFVVALPLWAADPPKLKPFKNFDAVLADLGENTLTIKRSEIELASKTISRTGRPKIKQVEKEYDFDLAPEVLFRRQDLPKGKDGKALRFSKEEYAELRAPLNAPGYKASRDDFKPGQMVRLFLGRETERDRPVVITIMLIRDTPDAPTPSDDKPKKKTNDKSKPS